MEPFVSRAGKKLQYALDKFKLSVKNLVVADFGSSTGGFVDCLLQNGAKKVYAIDTCYGELAWKLRNDPRVVVKERTNAMHIILPQKVDLITIDVSWTKQKYILPNALKNLKKGGVIIALIKPHYEVGKAKLAETEVQKVLRKVRQEIREIGLELVGLVESPIVGEKGKNREFLCLVKE